MYRLFSKKTNKKYDAIAIILLFTIFFAVYCNFGSYKSNIEIKSLYISSPEKFQTPMSEKTSSADSEKTESIKHILIWTEKNLKPLINLGEGRTVFIEKKCEWNNCYVTGDRNLLGDYTEFEAIIFGGTQLYLLRYKNDLPKRRDPKQKYIYANLESAASYPVCTSVWNYFFNTTWTYRLDSTLFWPYFIIEDSNNIRVGPKKNIHWMNISDMDPIDKDLKVKFKFILEVSY